MKSSSDLNQLIQNFLAIIFFALVLCGVIVLRSAPTDSVKPMPTIAATVVVLRATPAPTRATIAPCQALAAPYLGRKSPYDQQDIQIILAGRKTYTDYCAVCHGSEGRGDGVGALILDIKPADFTDAEFMSRMPIDCQFAIINEGVGRSMPAWKQQLGEDEIWKVLHYARGFSREP